ncbi:PilZ domain-containing protein [Lichenifustis flavocetrariae]|uniref:PilZ domain-containing protein n=1 Tax=Lichenifustis flavocetrariae TaxID=2949735 RepID=A0AA42CME9_9HYPH|nr:PilZ domain-containing protein [Lichenifustis flavocetrariae]MCW6512483.1 PilZ domain-containing protein [Lichenifustis flavocetrariae]
MLERRTDQRNRTYLGGRILFNHRSNSLDCLVRNMSPNGAKIVFSGSVVVPSEFELSVNLKGESVPARVQWRTETEAGLVFLRADRGTVVSIDTARRIRQLEADRAMLARRVAQLSEPM